MGVGEQAYLAGLAGRMGIGVQLVQELAELGGDEQRQRQDRPAPVPARPSGPLPMVIMPCEHAKLSGDRRSIIHKCPATARDRAPFFRVKWSLGNFFDSWHHATDPMQIILNGESREIPDALTAAGLVELLDLGGKRLAMEVNEAIVPRSRFAQHVLAAGDKVEIVHAIGGG